MTQDILKECAAAVLEGDRDRAGELARRALDAGLAPLDAIENGFAAGIREAGAKWESGEYFLPELAFSAEAMKAAMDVLQPALLDAQSGAGTRACVIIGTVQGDIHDIGKTLVATMLSANGYRVIDLGADVAHSDFVDAAAKADGVPLFVCMSALLTTTMSGQGDVIDLLRQGELRDRVRVVVGGAPTSKAWAQEIGADAYAENAVDAVRVIESLL